MLVYTAQPSASSFLAETCAESVLYSSPDSSPELFYAPRFQSSGIPDKAALKNAQRERTKRRETLSDSPGRGLFSVQEEADSDSMSENDRFPFCLQPTIRHRPYRLLANSKSLGLSSTRINTFLPSSVPLASSLPPAVKKRVLSSHDMTGTNAPLHDLSFHVPSRQQGSIPEEEQDVPGMVTNSGSDEEDGSDSGGCTTPIATSTFGVQPTLVHPEDDGEIEGAQTVELGRRHSFAIIKRRISSATNNLPGQSPVPAVANAPLKSVLGPGMTRNLPSSGPSVRPFDDKRHFSLPSLAQIQRRVAYNQGHHQWQQHSASLHNPVRRSSDPEAITTQFFAPSISVTTPEEETTSYFDFTAPSVPSSSSGSSRLPPFLLARQQREQKGDRHTVIPPRTLVDLPELAANPSMTTRAGQQMIVPTLTITPPPEREESSRLVRQVMEVGRRRIDRSLRDRKARSLGVELDWMSALEEEEDLAIHSQPEQPSRPRLARHGRFEPQTLTDTQGSKNDSIQRRKSLCI